MSWISSAACSKSAAVRQSCPADSESAAAWTELAGASPEKGAEFFDKLMSKDDGWLASLYDALARIHGPVQDYLTDPVRMKRFYTAVRGRITSPGPARPVFRSNTDMMLLTTRLRLDADGKPHIPGGLEVWKNLFVNHPQGKYDGKLTRLATTWKEPDDVLEALFALCRKAVENEPLKIFMAVSDLDRNRATPLEPLPWIGWPATIAVRRPVRHLQRVAQHQRQVHQPVSRYCRGDQQDSRSAVPLRFRRLLPGADRAVADLRPPGQHSRKPRPMPHSPASPARFVSHNHRELFDAGRNGVKSLLAAAPTHPGACRPAAGADRRAPGRGRARRQRSARRRSNRRSTDSGSAAHRFPGYAVPARRSHREYRQGREAEHRPGRQTGQPHQRNPAPRASLTANEKNAMGFGYWTEKHIDAERKLNLRLGHRESRRRSREAEGRPRPAGAAAPRYAPGLQLCPLRAARRADPVHQSGVRSQPRFPGHAGHRPHLAAHRDVRHAAGRPMPAGAWSARSPALPYALAEAEQNFLIPDPDPGAHLGRPGPANDSQRQDPALVERHARRRSTGSDCICATAASCWPKRRSIRDRANSCSRLWHVCRTGPHQRGRPAARSGDVKDAVERVTPAELFSVAREIASKRSRRFLLRARRDSARCTNRE